MRRHAGRWLLGVTIGVLAASAAGFAQEPPPQTPPQQTPPPTPPAGQAADPPSGRRGDARPAARQNMPAPGANLTQQQLQEYLDIATLYQADRALQLTADQYPNFVTRLRKLQTVRWQHLQQRRRLLREIGGLVQGPGPFRDEVVAEKLKALEDLNQKGTQELRQAEADLDGVLVPWQRAKFRILEERIEQMKLDLLMKLRPLPGAGGK